MSSAAVVIGALRVKYYRALFYSNPTNNVLGAMIRKKDRINFVNFEP